MARRSASIRNRLELVADEQPTGDAMLTELMFRRWALRTWRLR
jgi:hypothetical protein